MRNRRPEGPIRGSGRATWLVLVVAALAALFLWLANAFPGALGAGERQARFLYGGILAMVLIGSLAVRRRVPFGSALRYAAIWIAIAAALLLAYTLKDEARGLFDRAAAELVPQRGRATGDGTITYRARRDGHFLVRAEVDGIPVDFLVDTGATDVVLSPADAVRVGFEPARLSFDRVYRTANGTTRGAPVRLERVSLGPITLRDVRASVNGAAMDTSLLGMSFLSRLSGYRIAGDKLTLIP